MKKLLVLALLLGLSMNMIACEKNAEDNNATKPEETVIEETGIEETGIEETAVDETIVEETVVEETAVDEVSYNLSDYDMYKEYFLSNLEDSVFMSQSQGPMYETQFALLDLNQDGHLDYVISGALGLRCAMLTEIYLWNEEEIEPMAFEGEPVFVGDKLLWFNAPDYEGAGEIYYQTTYALAFDGMNAKTICNSNEVTQYYDTETGEELAEEIIISENYSINDQLVSKEEYKTMENASEAECKTIEWVNMDKESIEKYFN